MTSEKILDVYECHWYQRYGEKYTYWCKYADFCNRCPEPRKVGTIKESELKK